MNYAELVARVSKLPTAELQAEAVALWKAREHKRNALTAATSPLTFREFVSRVNSRFIWYRHCEAIASVLERVLAGELRRVIIMAPPRSGKSELLSRLFSAYHVYRYPERFVALASYGAELAYDLSRAARRNYYGVVNAESAETKAVKHWETGKGGGAWATGVGGAATGKGYALGIIDDPIKDDRDAQSDLIRERAKDWYRSVWYTRAEPDASIVLTMCMTGDTPVLRPDGSETPLRDIRPGDEIATFSDDGSVTTSRVVNWANQGKDDIFALSMASGRTVRANVRHPFWVIDESGEGSWVRLGSLRAGMRVRSLTEPIEGSGAPGMDASGQPRPKGCVCPTTTRHDGQQGFAPHPTTQSRQGLFVFGSAMGSLLRSISGFWKSRVGGAPSVVVSPKRSTSRSTGRMSSASITATIPESFGDCSATTATSLWPAPTLPTSCDGPLNTWGASTDEIVSVESAGREDVFDIEVERTHRFIANRLDSSNTRWHEMDLAGYLLAEESGEKPERWHVVNLQSIHEPEGMMDFPGSCTVEPDWRAPGDPLVPERYPLEALQRIEQRIGPRAWGSLHQQYPRPRDGSMFKWSHFADRFLDAIPAGMVWLAYWDTAGTEGAGDHTAGALVGYNARAGRFHIAEVVRGQWGPSRKDLEIRATCDRWKGLVGLSQVWLESEAGIGGKDRTRATVAALVGYRVQSEHPTGSKTVRAEVWAAQQEAGNVTMSRGDWNHGFISRSTAFPFSDVDDEQDAVSGAFAKISTLNRGIVGLMPEDQERLSAMIAAQREAVA